MIKSKQKDEQSNSSLHNALAIGTTVKGDISTETDFRLDGNVEGNIRCNGKIVVGPKSQVKGNIVSVNAEIMGNVEGSLQVDEKLVLKATATIQGDITCCTLEIEPQARFNGICKMISKE